MAVKEYYFESDRLMIWRPLGILDTSKINEFIKFIEESSLNRDPHFSRFIDLSQISGISVEYQDLYPIARQRKSYFRTNIKQRVKMAFLANDPFSYGMARMYQSLSDGPGLDVCISGNREEVSAFLGVGLDQISP
jgi:hypothetical protein